MLTTLPFCNRHTLPIDKARTCQTRGLSQAFHKQHTSYQAEKNQPKKTPTCVRHMCQTRRLSQVLHKQHTFCDAEKNQPANTSTCGRHIMTPHDGPHVPSRHMSSSCTWQNFTWQYLTWRGRPAHDGPTQVRCMR
jgi:hypothetical protein